VAAAFNDNGAGVRGDLAAVVSAILLDPEANSDSPSTSFGHLMEPVLFITTTLRGLGLGGPPVTTDFVLGESFLTPGQAVPLAMGQDLFLANSVFNYYSPNYVLPGTGLKAPEFQLLDTASAFARVNFVELVVYHKMTVNTNRPQGTWLDLSSLEPLATGDGSALVNELNLRLLHGDLSDALRTTILGALAQMPSGTTAQLLARVQEAAYLTASSSEYQVRR
jgi:hypothetical protein